MCAGSDADRGDGSSAALCSSPGMVPMVAPRSRYSVYSNASTYLVLPSRIRLALVAGLCAGSYGATQLCAKVTAAVQTRQDQIYRLQLSNTWLRLCAMRVGGVENVLRMTGKSIRVASVARVQAAHLPM